MNRKFVGNLFQFTLMGLVACNGDGGESGTDTETESDTDTDTDSDSDSDTDTWPQLGVCGIEGSALVFADSFVGTQDYYLTGDNGHGKNICVVRFDVSYVGEGPKPDECPDCYWAHKVELSNPQVVVDEGEVCEKSDLGLDSDAIAAIDGTQVSYGYAPEMSGHMEIFFQYSEETGQWGGMTQSTSWDEKTGELTYKTNRWCGYQ